MEQGAKQRLLNTIPAPVILAAQEAEIRRTTVQNQPRQIVWEPYLENTQHRTGGVAQVVEYLPCKCQALRKNPIQKKKKKTQKQPRLVEWCLPNSGGPEVQTPSAEVGKKKTCLTCVTL
jgi:hypothetical protein